MTDATARHVEPLVERLFARYEAPAPGAALLLMEGERVLVRRGFGSAELEMGVAVGPATNFRLASVSKQFTAMAILLLEEEGLLAVGDPVGRWLDLPSWRDSVTIHHLLTHTAGIADYEDHLPRELDRQLLDEDVRRILADREELYFAPGTAYRYSNSGYALLARIAEEASGDSFAAVLRRSIFAPLGMSGSCAHVKGEGVVDNRAFGYSMAGSEWVLTDQGPTSAVLGDGGIYSSVDDLALWSREILAPRFFSPALVERATVPRIDTGDGVIRYGYGWRSWSHHGLRILAHTGETIGFRNALVLAPERELAAVILTNRNEGRPLEPALDLIREIAGI